jgi:hypothetical protein
MKHTTGSHQLAESHRSVSICKSHIANGHSFPKRSKRIGWGACVSLLFPQRDTQRLIKRLKASYVAPETIELGFTDEGGKVYTLNEVMKLKEETWFSRGVALARVCNQHIVDSSLQKLEELRQSGTQHQLIAVACSINHSREIRSLYRERGYTAEIIHSK